MLLASAAAVVVRGELGSLARQVELAAAQSAKSTTPAVDATHSRDLTAKAEPASLAGGKFAGVARITSDRGRSFFNGLGGFIDDQRAYQIDKRAGRQTPLPWSNVIANPRFGCLVTEAGGGYTWAENSREFKLTSWANDPVSDTPAEWLYVRDEVTGEIVRPLPQPGRDPAADYLVEHRAGQSSFRHAQGGLELETLMAVAADDPVKFICVRIHNTAPPASACIDLLRRVGFGRSSERHPASRGHVRR